jgi:two-component system chemotaxis response regulator CheY
MTVGLVVDDSKVVRKFGRRILEELSIEVFEAEDGKDGLEKCELNKPDVILLDWNMPIMDGITFLKEMRKNADYASIIVIFCTTENDFTKIQEAMLAGANEYIMKPFDSEIVKTKLIQTGVISG